MRRPTHHGGATSSRFYGVRWKGYFSRIYRGKADCVVCFLCVLLSPSKVDTIPYLLYKYYTMPYLHAPKFIKLSITIHQLIPFMDCGISLPPVIISPQGVHLPILKYIYFHCRMSIAIFAIADMREPHVKSYFAIK